MSRDRDFAAQQRDLITSTRLRGRGGEENDLDPASESDASTILENPLAGEFSFTEPNYSETPFLQLRGNNVNGDPDDDESLSIGDDDSL